MRNLVIFILILLNVAVYIEAGIFTGLCISLCFAAIINNENVMNDIKRVIYNIR